LLKLFKAASSLGILLLLLWRPFQKRFYKFFIRFHQILAALFAITVFLHIPSTIFPRLYLYVTVGILLSTSILKGFLLILHNGILTLSPPKIGEIDWFQGNNSPIQVKILPKRPLSIKPGQYINITILSFGFRSCTQSHPFVVALWTGQNQSSLELIIQPRRGWTRRLKRAQNSNSIALFTGPHGVPVPVDDYEYIFMISSGYGIVANLPLLERLVMGTISREVRARRICLVWEVQDEGESDN